MKRLRLTPTEALVVDELKKWDRTTLELLKVIWIDDDFYNWWALRTCISKLNSKQKIILTPKEIGEDKYRLQEKDFDYVLMENIKITTTWIEEAKKMICYNCSYKRKQRETVILITVTSTLWFLIGFLLAFNVVETVVEVDIETLWDILIDYMEE